jgi:hypothetical protein
MSGRRRKGKQAEAESPSSAPRNVGNALRGIFEPTSVLLERIQDGLGAMRAGDRDCIEIELRPEFGHSIDLDEALREGHDREHRWDYLLGHEPTSAVIAVEPHSAKDDELSRVIAKRKAARDQLSGHLRANGRIAVWLWVASGRVRFADTEKTRRILDQNGIQFAGTRVLRRHIPSGK